MLTFFLCIHVCMYLHKHIYTWMHTCKHTCIHTHILAYSHLYVHIYIHTFIHIFIRTYTCIHAYIHIYIHTDTHACIHKVRPAYSNEVCRSLRFLFSFGVRSLSGEVTLVKDKLIGSFIVRVKYEQCSESLLWGAEFIVWYICNDSIICARTT